MRIKTCWSRIRLRRHTVHFFPSLFRCPPQKIRCRKSRTSSRIFSTPRPHPATVLAWEGLEGMQLLWGCWGTISSRTQRWSTSPSRATWPPTFWVDLLPQKHRCQVPPRVGGWSRPSKALFHFFSSPYRVLCLSDPTLRTNWNKWTTHHLWIMSRRKPWIINQSYMPQPPVTETHMISRLHSYHPGILSLNLPQHLLCLHRMKSCSAGSVKDQLCSTSLISWSLFAGDITLHHP